ncbi:hypothetical protein LIN78_11045 [Leeia sp. TBRC 13508]|uniref:Uncharacterized protein n=1 Tax=Leeia speluncae TaxID=2884804 RepID=A0ABS8D7H1_9NEIS|nr:hypothetical protein [Leeia speluncae]MCB6184082.1 hypothetical protein [Leeia speluncae]
MSLVVFYIQTLKMALRSKVWPLVLFCVFCVAVSMFVANAFSPRQPSIVSIDIGISATRVLGLFVGLTIAQLMFAADIDRKLINSVLVLPVHRILLLVGRWLAVVSFVLVFQMISYGCMYLMAKWGLQKYPGLSQPVIQHLPLVFIGSFIEQLLIVSVMFLFIVISKTPFLAFVLSFIFAISARSIHAAINYILFDPDAASQLKQSLTSPLLWLKWIIPDLSRLDWRDSVLYGVDYSVSQVLSNITANMSYAGLILMMAILLLNRRKFE